MNESKKSLSVDEMTIELRRLFEFQDRRVEVEKIAAFAFDLADLRFPSAAVMKAMQALRRDDVERLKYSVIVAEIRKFIETDPFDRCDHCDSGFLAMRDSGGRFYALACSCEKGSDRARAVNLVRWNGEEKQWSKNREMSKVRT